MNCGATSFERAPNGMSPQVCHKERGHPGVHYSHGFEWADAPNARALAMEEAAQLALAQPYFPGTNVGKRQQWVKEEIARKARELAPLDPSLVAALSTARSLAMEEAARAIEAAFEVDEDVAAIDVVRALAPLPASLVAVPGETLEQVREALRHARDHQARVQAGELNNALAALERVR